MNAISIQLACLVEVAADLEVQDVLRHTELVWGAVVLHLDQHMTAVGQEAEVGA